MHSSIQFEGAMDNSQLNRRWENIFPSCHHVRHSKFKLCLQLSTFSCNKFSIKKQQSEIIHSYGVRGVVDLFWTEMTYISNFIVT